MTIFAMAATIMFIFLAVIWSKDSFFNFCLKLFFVTFSLWGIFEVATELGYVVQIAGG